MELWRRGVACVDSWLNPPIWTIRPVISISIQELFRSLLAFELALIEAKIATNAFSDSRYSGFSSYHWRNDDLRNTYKTREKCITLQLPLKLAICACIEIGDGYIRLSGKNMVFPTPRKFRKLPIWVIASSSRVDTLEEQGQDGSWFKYERSSYWWPQQNVTSSPRDRVLGYVFFVATPDISYGWEGVKIYWEAIERMSTVPLSVVTKGH